MPKETRSLQTSDQTAKILRVAAKAYMRGLSGRHPTTDEARIALREMSDGIDIPSVKFGDELYTDTPLRKLVEIAYASSPVPDHWSEAVKRFLAPTGPQTDPNPLTMVVADAAPPIATPTKQPGEGRAFWVLLTLGAGAAFGVWIWGQAASQIPAGTYTSIALQPTNDELVQSCRIVRLTLAISGRTPTSEQQSELNRCP